MHVLLCYFYIDPYRRLHHVIFMHCYICTLWCVSLDAKLLAGFVSETQHNDKIISKVLVIDISSLFNQTAGCYLIAENEINRIEHIPTGINNWLLVTLFSSSDNFCGDGIYSILQVASQQMDRNTILKRMMTVILFDSFALVNHLRQIPPF